MFGFKPKKLAVPAGTGGNSVGEEATDAAQSAAPLSAPEPKPLPLDEPEEQVTAGETSDEPDSMLDFTASEPAPDEGQGEESSLADLFAGTNQQEEKSSLTAILERTPDASIEELLTELNEIREMLRGRLDEE
mgnify:CR=1 FL=1